MLCVVAKVSPVFPPDVAMSPSPATPAAAGQQHLTAMASSGGADSPIRILDDSPSSPKAAPGTKGIRISPLKSQLAPIFLRRPTVRTTRAPPGAATATPSTGGTQASTATQQLDVPQSGADPATMAPVGATRGRTGDAMASSDAGSAASDNSSDSNSSSSSASRSRGKQANKLKATRKKQKMGGHRQPRTAWLLQ